MGNFDFEISRGTNVDNIIENGTVKSITAKS